MSVSTFQGAIAITLILGLKAFAKFFVKAIIQALDIS